MNFLIKGSRIVDCKRDFTGDVYVEDGFIKEIGNLNKDCKTINGKNLVILPSFIDMHCHFRDPGFLEKEDIESGSRAAAHGGYTFANLMANTYPVCSSMEIAEYVKNKAAAIGLLDVHQTLSITKDMNGEDLSHLDKIDSSVKFISDDGRGVERSDIMYKAMKKAADKNIILIAHEEDKNILNLSSRLSENLMTVRDIEIGKETGGRLHIAHVSTKEAVEYIYYGKRNRCKVTCEVTPHHIALDNCEYSVNPPLREKYDREALIKAIKKGYIDVIGTDHAPHTAEDKKKNVPGISGIETAFSVCYTSLVRAGHINLKKLSALMTGNPGRIAGLKNGKIEEGYPADFVIVDINKSYFVDSSKFKSKGKNTPFEGMKLYGAVIATFKKGKLTYDGGL